MYSIVLLAALGAGGESANNGKKNCHPPPILDGGGPHAYHNRGGWGPAYGGYGWPGYHCPDYSHVRPTLTLPDEPLVVPPPRVPQSDDDDDQDPPAKPVKNGGDKKKKNGDKKDGNGNGSDEKKEDDVIEGRPGDTAGVGKLGLRVADLTASRRRYLGYDGNVGGVAVSFVQPRGNAARDGLREGMVILSVDGVAVSNARQAADALRGANAGARVRVADPLGERRTITLGD